MPRIVLVAGEASGDLHAAAVAAAIRRLRPDQQIAAIGGPRLAEQGVEMLQRDDRLGVMGFVEILKHVPSHYLLLRRLESMMRDGEISLLILVDYPGFNMRLAALAASLDVRVLYYVTPQVWAWGAGRLPKLARHVTRAAVILRFEEQLLRDHGVNATFVGHPMLDRAVDMPSKSDARAALSIPDSAELLALFPGSRQQEINRHLDDFVETARLLQRLRPGLEVRVSVAPTVRLDASRCPFPLVHARSLEVLRAADAALCKSGTTTLEAAIAGCPLVVAYRTDRVSYALARRFVSVPHIGLVNVVAGREVAREFIQAAVDPVRIAPVLSELIDSGSPGRTTMLAGLQGVRDQLGEPGAADRVARMALELV